MKIRLAILLFIFSATPIWAAGLLGGSYDECVARLGKPTRHQETGDQRLPDLWEFEKGDWIITAGLNNRHVRIVAYRRRDKLPISAEQIQALDTAYSGGYSWTAGAHRDYSLATCPDGPCTLSTSELQVKKTMTAVCFCLPDVAGFLQDNQLFDLKRLGQ